MNYTQPAAMPQQAPLQSMQTQALPKTNKIFVTSLDDALNRPADYNSVIIYLHQDQPLLFEITTDPFGKKTHKTIPLGDPIDYNTNSKAASVITAEQADKFATKDELKSLEEKVDKLIAETSNISDNID